MKYTLLFLICIQLIPIHLIGQSLYRVTAKSGLIIRSEPNTQGQRIGRILFENWVEVIQKTEQKEVIQDGDKSIEGCWVKIRFYTEKTTEGYIFDGYLEKIHLSNKFILVYPDTAKLNPLALQSDFSPFYLYLKTTYLTRKDSVKYYDWDTKRICAFQQTFENQIKYSVENCDEGGISEQIILPKMELSLIKAFITYLFYDKENIWIKNTKYQPKNEGAGCYYEIKQTEKNTIIKIFCGC